MKANVGKEGVRLSAVWPLVALVVLSVWFVGYSLSVFEGAFSKQGQRTTPIAVGSPVAGDVALVNPTRVPGLATPTCQQLARASGMPLDCDATAVPTVRPQSTGTAAPTLPPMTPETVNEVVAAAPSVVFVTPTPDGLFRVYLFMDPISKMEFVEYPHFIATPDYLPPGVLVIPPDVSEADALATLDVAQRRYAVTSYATATLVYGGANGYVTMTPAPTAGPCPWGADNPNCALMTYITPTPLPRGGAGVGSGEVHNN